MPRRVSLSVRMRCAEEVQRRRSNVPLSYRARNWPILRRCEMIPNVQKRHDYCWRSLKFARQRRVVSDLLSHLDNACLNLDCDQRSKL